ncbi:MarR family transcriptional regulator [Janthinobacterium sp. BJB412]|nr:MarR family transcriptional regulator [Janthinobacterium sp. BJB412]
MKTVFDSISSPTATRIATGLSRIGTAMRHKAWQRATASGLTPTQADIIALLAARQLPVRLSTIAEQLAITAATASDAVASLVGKALVHKGRAPDDGRAIALSLTPAGAQLADSVSEWGGFMQMAAATLSADEQTLLLRLIIKMIRAMQESGDIPLNRMCVTCSHFQPQRHKNARNPHHCGLVDAAFGERHLRLDCPEHEQQSDALLARRQWSIYLQH